MFIQSRGPCSTVRSLEDLPAAYDNDVSGGFP